MKKGLFLRALSLVAAIALCICFVSAPTIEAKAQNTSDGEPMYALANGFYKIRSVANGKYLLGNNAGYEAQAVSAENGMTFFLKPTALGQYLLYDENSKYLTYNMFNAIVRNTTLNDKVKWNIEVYDDGSCSLYSEVKKQYACVKGTSLKWKSTPDDSCLFVFEATTGSNPYPEAEVCMSITDAEGNEVPVTEAMARFEVGEPIIGYADTHAHLNHDLGSGAATFYGKTFSSLGILDALKDCTDVHGINGNFSLWSMIVDGAATHNTSGYPNFDYWPTAYSTSHIQTYYKWLERSYLAGQRLLVHQCVNNGTLGQITNALPPYAGGETNDMKVVDIQIANIYEMQDYIDAQYGGPGNGWFRVVTSPLEARQVISEGKMAVIIGVEVDTFLDCDKDYIGLYHAGEISEIECNTALARMSSKLDELYAMGVRSAFPIHALNNGFGGCQLYQGEVFSIMNYLNRGDFYQPEAALNIRVRYKQPKADEGVGGLGHQNTIGLTETGEWLIHELIDRRMVIEVDHMSDKTFNAVLDICWEEKYPGIICSHTRILDMFNEEANAWEQLDIPRMIKVFQLGGIISPMLWETLDYHQICASDYLEFMIELSEGGVPATGVLDNDLYQHYGGPYTVPTTWYNTNSDDSDDLILGIPYGSDVNGACMLPYFDNYEGRFEEADYDNFDALHTGIYSANVSDVDFDVQVTGNRSFDINGDRGVAHYGLVPDYWERLSSRPDIVNIDATFNSAEAYIRMLERVERYSDTYPSRSESDWITVDTEDWHNNK
ncbi:MAG: membrane dipeptidase [Lachnospiraceae bacterium]|nr:membrane dipeptidase [Lachnospiraceae bacterium]